MKEKTDWLANIIKVREEYPGYSEVKPSLSKWIYLWLLAILAGVSGLGYVAYTSMIRQGFEPFPAACFALLIEVGTFGAGFNLVRGNKVTLFEIVVGVITSGVYNYVHIRAVNIQAVTKVADTDWLLLGVYGVGPLLIAFSAALWIGREIAKHEQATIAWGQRARAWQDTQHTETVQAEQKDKEQERSLAARLDLEKEKLRIQAEIERERIRAEQETKAEIARIRIEARERLRNDNQARPEITGNFPPADWRKLPDEDKEIVRSLSTGEIVQRYNVSDRTARNWKANALNGNGKTH